MHKLDKIIIQTFLFFY